MFKFVILASCLLMLSLAVNSFKLDLDELERQRIFSEKDMFYNHGVKTVEFLERVYPTSKINSIGQVGGLDTDSNGDLIVFHRATRTWATDAFPDGVNFDTNKYSAIEEDVLDLIDGMTFKKKDSWGANKFYMPHGIRVDHEDNIWLTDVAMHQVFKFNLDQSDEPLLVLGAEFAPGNDETHLCKPTSIDLSKTNGDVYVGDGYCNNRIVRYDKDGNFIKSYQDSSKPLVVVHSVAVIDNLNFVCGVSREEGRIVCFDIDSGNKVTEITDENMKTVYAIEYDPINEVLHAVTGENHGQESIGLTFRADKEHFGKLQQKWNADNDDLSNTHGLAISPDGSKLYLGQLNSEIDLFAFE